MATSPIAAPGPPTTTVVVTAAAAKSSSPRLSPVHPHAPPPRVFETAPSISHPPSPEMGRSASPCQAPDPEPTPPPPPVVAAAAPSVPVPELATLGVNRHRRRSRPSVSPERPGAINSPTSRHNRLRRQSTTLDEGIPTGGKTGRRGSRPFLSPDGPSATATFMSALQSRRDSLSPDSAAVMDGDGQMGGGGSSSKNHRRRDSRPHLSPDAMSEGGGDGGGSGSPRGSRIRRQSTTTDDIFK